MIDITLIGTSALLPLPDRALTSVFLTCGGHSILFDCGEGTQSAARKAGVSLYRTDIIALTHYHGDHIFGLPGLMQTMGMMGKTEPLTLIGPPDIKEGLRHVLHLAGGLPYPVFLAELPPEGAALSELIEGCRLDARLIPFPTQHRVPSQGYVFSLPRAGKFLPDKARALNVPMPEWHVLQNGGTVETASGTVRPEDVMEPARRGIRFVFSGDTRPCASLEEAAKDADLFICEATYAENEQESAAAEHGHMTFAQAARTARSANARRLWLTHYSQMIEDPEAHLPIAKEIFPNAECGTDGKQLRLRFGD